MNMHPLIQKEETRKPVMKERHAFGHDRPDIHAYAGAVAIARERLELPDQCSLPFCTRAVSEAERERERERERGRDEERGALHGEYVTLF